jgi:serine protease Do
MAMRRHVWTVTALLPLLFASAYGAQNWTVDSSSHPWAFSSEDGGTTSYLGVDIADVTGERLNTLKLKEEKGVEVTMVDQDAPAGKAGIKEHDVIVSMNGTAIESGAQLRRMIHETPPGRLVSFGLSRDGQPMTIKLQLADKHNEFAFAGPKPGDIHVQIPEFHVPDIDIPSMNMVVVTSSARSGLMVENITPQLGDFFGVKNGNGVLIRSVEKGSRAEKAGFRAGDVIVKVNQQAVHDTSDFSHAVRGRSADSVSVGFIRDKKEQNLNLPLPSRKESSEFLEQESFDSEPLFEAFSKMQLTKLNGELAKLQPQIEIARESSRTAGSELRKELCREQAEFRRQGEKQKDQFKKEFEILKRQLQSMRQDWL